MSGLIWLANCFVCEVYKCAFPVKTLFTERLNILTSDCFSQGNFYDETLHDVADCGSSTATVSHVINNTDALALRRRHEFRRDSAQLNSCLIDRPPTSKTEIVPGPALPATAASTESSFRGRLR